jgi:hypothetical protein
LPASSYSIASSSEQQRGSRSSPLVAAVVLAVVAAVAAVVVAVVAAVVAAAVVAAVAAAVVAAVAAAAPLSQLNSASTSYVSLRRLSASRPTTSCLAAA